jgi:hypothetical protein
MDELTDRDTTTTREGEAQGEGGRLVTVDGRILPLRAVTLQTDARGGLARVVPAQRFVPQAARDRSLRELARRSASSPH